MINSNAEYRIGVIGYGLRGRLARYAHNPTNGVQVVAVADSDPVARAKFQRDFGDTASAMADWRALLARPDLAAVFICSPDDAHEEQTVAALEAGKAVYLEKPMAITITGCDRILATAARTKQKLYVGHNMRHFPVMQKMKELIDAGAIGRPMTAWCRHFVSYGGDAYFKDWHADRTRTTGLLLQKGAHDLDILHWLGGGFTETVTAMGGLTLYDKIPDRHDPSVPGDATFRNENWPPQSQKGLNPVIDVEDVSMVLMELDNGVFASYQQCHFTPDAWRNYTIIGTEGRIENFGDLPGPSVVRLWNRRHYYFPTGDAEYPVPHEEGSHGGADRRIVEEFLQYLRNGGSTATSPIAARCSVAAGYMATMSLRNGSQPMRVPKLAPELRSCFP